MTYQLNSEITIGKFQFSGVHQVQINRSIHSPVETAKISVPSVAVVSDKDHRNITGVFTANKFAVGDYVDIRLGYNGDMSTEFRGFVKSKDLNMPLEIACEGYSWLLRKNKVNLSKASVSLKDLLKAAVGGLDGGYNITVKCIVDCTFSNVQLNGSGLDLLNLISQYSDGCLACFFIEPDVLWCGLIYSPVSAGADPFGKPKVQYRLGFNVLKDNTLAIKTADDDPVVVKYSKRLSSGTVINASSAKPKGKSRDYSRILNQVESADALQRFANEKAQKMNYAGYEGNLTSFLVPAVSPGTFAYITDSRYTDRSGTYLVESVATHFGVNGARRTIEVGLAQGTKK